MIKAFSPTLPLALGSEFVSTTQYDGMGLARESWSDLGGKVVTTIPVAGATETLDSTGLRKRVYTDARGNVDRVEEGRATLSQTGAYDYDGRGRLQWFEDGNGNQHQYTYDSAGRLQSVQRQGAGAAGPKPYVAYTYTGPWVTSLHEGEVTDPAVVEWDYDALGRTTEKRVAEGSSWATYTWEWDGSGATAWNGVRHRTTDPAGATEYRYDESAPWGSLGRLTSVVRQEVGEADLQFGYEYDFEGQAVHTVWPSGAEVFSSFDDGWKTQDTVYLPDPGSNTDIDYSYDPNWGVLSRWTAEQGQYDWTMDFVRSSPNQLDEMSLVYPGINAVNTHGYYTRYDNGWLESKRIEPMMSLDDSIGYDYDDLGRVSRVYDPKTQGRVYEQYRYDVAGNLTGFDQNHGTAQRVWDYDVPAQFGEIASRSDGSVTDDHVWDAVTGRMESWNTTDPAGNTTRSFEYDGAGRLRWMERKEGSSAPVETELFYDVDDNVVLERRGSDEIRRFQGSRWDANGAVETVLPQIRVVTDPAGRMALHYAYVDVDGQAVSVFGSNGSLVSTEVTGAYGVPLQGAPSDYSSSPEAWVVDGLHGQEEDRGNEVSHFGARHTLFRDGMWMQPEPLLGTPKAVSFVGRPGASGSVYAGGNPVAFLDTTGWDPATYEAVQDLPDSIEFDEPQTEAITTMLGTGILEGRMEGTALVTSEGDPNEPLVITPGRAMRSGSSMMRNFSKEGGLLDLRPESAIPAGGGHTHPDVPGFVQNGLSTGDKGSLGTDRATASAAEKNGFPALGVNIVVSERPRDDGTFRVDVAVTSGDTQAFYVGALNVDSPTLSVRRLSSRSVKP